jgi:SnoaL-like domain
MDTRDAQILELFDREAIKECKARYFRCMDEKKWDEWALVFTEDARMEVPEADMEVDGRDAIVAAVSGVLEGVRTVHHGHMPEIEITSPTTARGVWAMQDFLQMPEGSPLGMKSMTGWGHYTETYELVDGEWRIKTLVLTRLRRDVEV